MDAVARRARLARSRLWLAVDAEPDETGPLVDAALDGGVDAVQLRTADLSGDELARAAEPLRRACEAHGALFLLDGRPDLVERAGADGALVDAGTATADTRRLVGAERLVGAAAHVAGDFGAEADCIVVAPEPALARAARDTLLVPWLARADGGDDAALQALLANGAPGLVVTGEALGGADPAAAARTLRAALPPSSAVVVRGDDVLLPQVEWLFGARTPAERGVAPHTHLAHTDLFILLEGMLELRLGDGTVQVPAGSCVAAEPHLVHGFRVPPGGGEARFLNLHAPGGWARGARHGLPPEERDTFGVDRALASTRPHVSAPGDGDRLMRPHRLAVVRLHTPHATVVEYLVEAGYDGADEHVHLRHADCFHVLEGELDFVVDDEAVRVEAGTSIVVPPGVPHALDGVGRARFLNVHAPSYGFADYLRQLDSGDAFDATVYDVYEV